VGDHTIHHKTPDTGATLTRVSVTAALPQRRWLAPASYVFAAAALCVVLWLHLLIGLLAGLLVYESVQSVAPLLERRLSNQRARIAVVFLLSVAVVGVIAGGILIGTAHFNKHDIPSIERLLGRLLQLADAIRANLPAWAIDYVPDDIDRIRDQAGSWISGHMAQIQLAGHAALRGFAHLLIGLILGAFIAIQSQPHRPLAAVLVVRIQRFALAFRRIVFAQFKISALNTAFTSTYLLVVLPMLHMRLPLSKSMVVLTFVVGLLPVVGNLISNTVIVLVSLSVSVPAAIGSAIFLVLIHKLE
jgi:predicted PurR-regulated permease PerM